METSTTARTFGYTGGLQTFDVARDAGVPTIEAVGARGGGQAAGRTTPAGTGTTSPPSATGTAS